MRESEQKSATTTFRWSQKSRAQLELAALVRGETLSEFIRRVIMREVRRELEVEHE